MAHILSFLKQTGRNQKRTCVELWLLAVISVCKRETLYMLVSYFVSLSETESITAVLHAYGAALKSRNVEEAVALYTSDGVIMPPHFTAAAGTTALRESYTRIFSSIQLVIKFSIDEIVVMSPDWAFARTTAEGTKTMLATQESEEHTNQELFIMKKEDGGWKIARYAFSTMKPLVQNGVRRS
ncbi:NTF2-like protein [Colletotrichum asianum]